MFCCLWARAAAAPGACGHRGAHCRAGHGRAAAAADSVSCHHGARCCSSSDMTSSPKIPSKQPSASPQLANLNVLANSEGHDLQIVGNIWIFPQELGSSFFIKHKCFHFGAQCVTFSTNRSSYQKSGLCYTQTERVCVYLFCAQRPHT